MKKQKKIAEQEEYQTPLEVLLSFLRMPHKIYRDIYIIVIERRLSAKPLLHNEESIAFLAQQVAVEPALMAEKVRNMARMKWIEFEQVGDRDTNQIFVISPIWHYKPGMDEAKFAIALLTYKATITELKGHQMKTREIYALMNSICVHTKEKIDGDLCKLARFQECQTCSHNLKKDKKA